MGSKGPSVAEQARQEREHPRYAHEATVTLHVGSKAITGKTSNVSSGGLCADVAEAVKTGTELVIDLQLVFDDDAQSEALRIQARVAWCTTLDDGFQIGLSFRPIDAAQAEDIALFLRYLDDGGGRAPKRPKLPQPIDDRFG